MGYRIEYGAKGSRRRRIKRLNKHHGLAFAGILPVVLLLVMLFWPAVRNILLPGDREVTAAALDTLAGELRNGEAFGSAVTAFCQEIIDHGLSEP